MGSFFYDLEKKYIKWPLQKRGERRHECGAHGVSKSEC